MTCGHIEKMHTNPAPHDVAAYLRRMAENCRFSVFHRVPLRPLLRGLGRVAGAAQKLDVPLVQGSATILQFSDMVPEQARAGASAPLTAVWPLCLDLFHQGTPLMAGIEAVSALWWCWYPERPQAASGTSERLVCGSSVQLGHIK